MPRRESKGGTKRPFPEDALTDEMKRWIVVRLAMFDGPTTVHREFAAQFPDAKVPAITAIQYYDPTGCRTPARQWIELFHHTRAEFLKEIASEPLANRAARIRRLGTLYEEAREAGDFETARKVIETAAKETGNVFTNIQKVQGAILPGQIADERTPEEARNMLADRLREAIDRLPKKAPDLTKH